MKCTFLGTGTSQGVPIIACTCTVCQSTNNKDKRLRTSIHLQIHDTSVVIDSGPDFRQQMLQNNINDLDAIVFTHAHKDHTAGLDDVRAINFVHNKYIDVLAEKIVLDSLQKEFYYIFESPQYPGIPLIHFHEINENIFQYKNISFTPIRVMHHRLPVFGFRVQDLVYITDANYISEAELQKCKNAKVLVLNALRHETHLSHFTLQEAIEIAKKLEAEKVYFTHISHQMGLHDEIQKTLPENMFLAYDGLQLNL